MDRTEVLTLIDRIKSEPSVLFLGQRYLRSYSDHDVFVETINSELCNGKLPQNASYYDIWKLFHNGESLKPEDFEKMFSAIRSIPEQNWLRSILTMRWGMVFTSAVDSCIAHCVGGDFNFCTVPPESKDRFKREYMNKNQLHGVYLYGSIDGSTSYPPETCDNIVLRRLRKSVNDRISWIYNDIIQEYGVLVIDGWDPETDWASSILDNATDMPYESIYLFGATEETKNNQIIQELIEDKIIVLIKESFAQALDSCGFFDSNDELYDYFSFETDVKTVTIQERNGKTRYINIPKSVLSLLDNRIVLFDDELGYTGRPIDVEEKGESFAKFLQQDPTSGWQLFTPETGYHFPREVDEELYNLVCSKLQKKKSSQWGTIILEGASNSGKTAALIELGMRLRSEHRCPVFYINGIPTQNQFDGSTEIASFEEKLKSIIKNYILNPQGIKDNWEERIVVLWDGNVGLDAIRRYQLLSSILMECNVLVIGTAYRHEQYDPSNNTPEFDYILVKGKLSPAETEGLKNVLKQVDFTLLDQFEKAAKKESPNLLYTLQQISKYKYSEEWREVAQSLSRHFAIEIDDSEQYTGKAIEERITWEVVNEAISKKGIAASWQMKLASLLEEMKGETSSDFTEDMDNEKRKKYIHYQHNIQMVNKILALAGQFSISLPITLLLRMLEKTPDLLSNENLFIIELLKNDSLVDYATDTQGYATAKFRHPSEAELYIKSNFGDEESQRKEKEVSLLCSIIENSKWDDMESRSVIALVRCFGPNSKGKYSENVNHDYDAYLDYLPEIANALKKYASNEPEAILVFAHFLREKYKEERSKGKATDKRRLEEAQNALNDVLEKINNEGVYSVRKNTYYRIIGEKCANLVWQLPQDRYEGSFSLDLFNELQELYRKAINCDWNSIGNDNFNANSLLDIWLNAVIRYLKSFETKEKALGDYAFQHIIADSVSYIDRLLVIDESFSSIALLEKIEKINELASNNSLQDLASELNQKNNDTFLFLKAHDCWRNEKYVLPQNPVRIDYIKKNLYSFPDDTQGQLSLGECAFDLKKQAKVAAEKAVLILEENMDLINRSKSCRCLYMLIRSKWLIYTNYMLLEENQLPKISHRQWDELYDLCKKYKNYCSLSGIEPQIGCELIRGVYLWSFTTEYSDTYDVFKGIRNRVANNKWIIERIGLCKLDSTDLRTFYVDIRKTQLKKRLDACICKEINPDTSANSLSLVGRYKIYVPDRVLDYLFNYQMAEPRNNIQKAVVVWFNLEGPTLGIPEEGKKERR